jgi:hypothetical protein
MVGTPDALAPPFTPDVANRRAFLNQRRRFWLLSVPHLYGGRYFYDLINMNHGLLTAMGNTSNGWRPTPRPGGYGHVEFDGSAGYIDAGNAPSLNISGSLTMAAWIRVDSFSHTYKLVMTKGVPDTSGRNYCFAVDPNNGNRGIYPQIVGVGGFNPDAIVLPVANAMSTGVWYHIGITYNNPLQTLGIYQNGLRTNQVTGLTGSPTTNSLNMIFGQGGTWGWFDGGMDDLGVWDVAFTDGDMWSLYDRSIHGYPDELNRLWPFLPDLLPAVGAPSAIVPPNTFDVDCLSGGFL